MEKENEFLATLPDYDKCLVNLSNSILKKFGAETIHDTLPAADELLKSDQKNVVVLVLDALGMTILNKHLKEDGLFRSHLAAVYDSVYPPTTVAATTSLMSGLYPDEHGWIGWDMYYPELDKNVSVFRNYYQITEKEDAKPLQDGSWDESSLNEIDHVEGFHAGNRFCPYETIVDRIEKAGGQAYFAMPFMPPYPQDLDAILDRTKDLCSGPVKKFIYAYWNEPDSTMHATGTMSSKTHEMVTSLEEKIGEFVEGLSDTLLVVTADHGHMDSCNLCISDYPEVLKCLKRSPSFEPRTINLFVKDEYKETFPKIFKDNFGEDFILLTREEVIANKVFGKGMIRDGLAEMIGDFVALSVGKTSVFITHLEAQLTPGGHAGLTGEEIKIPLIAIEK